MENMQLMFIEFYFHIQNFNYELPDKSITISYSFRHVMESVLAHLLL